MAIRSMVTARRADGADAPTAPGLARILALTLLCAWGALTLVASAGTIVGAAWNSANVTPENTKFIAAYKAKYNADPDQFAAQAYTGVYIYAAALKNAGANVDRKGLRDALAGIKGLATPLGSFSFQADRNADHLPVVQVVTNGKFDVLK